MKERVLEAIARVRAYSLRAPVAGGVQQLTVHTLGAIVTPAQTAAPASAATLVSATHISSAGSNEVVTASAEQMPSICNVTGLLSTSGSIRTVRASLIS